MSTTLISRSPDLARLRDEGFDIEVRGAHLVMKNVPYVAPGRVVKRGIIASPLNLAGDVAAPPSDHTVRFAGERPCKADGSHFEALVNSKVDERVGKDLTLNFSFSAKPEGKRSYSDNYEKFKKYANILTAEARAIDPDVTAAVFEVTPTAEEESVFHYTENASALAGITEVARRLEDEIVGIIGLGGTGAYILDLVAKAPVRRIDLFDGKVFSQHNAFRAPGAPSVEILRARMLKVEYYADIYSQMHRHITPHGHHIDAATVCKLDGMTFVFVCVDDGPSRRLIVEALEVRGLPFIDVGMGLELAEGNLSGTLRTTLSTAADRTTPRSRIPTASLNGNDLYNRNIQVADLNSLNASMAVIRWKKLRGFYADGLMEPTSSYTIDTNLLLNKDVPCDNQ